VAITQQLPLACNEVVAQVINSNTESSIA